MDWKEFIASLAASVAWPAAVVIAVVLFRAQLAGLLEGPLKSLKAGPLAVEFWERQLAEVGESVLALDPSPTPSEHDHELQRIWSLTTSVPSAAVLEAFRIVEQELYVLARKAKLNAPENMPFPNVVRLLQGEGLIDQELVSAIVGLRKLRNTTAHCRDPEATISVAQAKEYVGLAEAVVLALRRLRES